MIPAHAMTKAAASSRKQFLQERHAMVDNQLARRGIADQRVLSAMRTVPREEFVPEESREHAYGDSALPIECGQTISQPFVVAMMAEAANIGRDERVLDVGTGSGYGAAVLAQLAGHVYSIERHQGLAERADRVMKKLGYENVSIAKGDGSMGWPERAPFDAVLVAARAPEPPPALLGQLAEGGRLIIPVGRSALYQQLVRLTKNPDGFLQEDLGTVAFVPLIGAEACR